MKYHEHIALQCHERHHEHSTLFWGMHSSLKKTAGPVGQQPTGRDVSLTATWIYPIEEPDVEDALFFLKNCLTCRSTTYKKRCFLEGPMESPIWGVWCRGGHFLNKSLFNMRKRALAFSFVLWTVLAIRIRKGSTFVEPLDPNPDPQFYGSRSWSFNCLFWSISGKIWGHFLNT